MKKILAIASSILIMSSCVSKKKLAEAQAEYSTFKASSENEETKKLFVEDEKIRKSLTLLDAPLSILVDTVIVRIVPHQIT